MSGPPAVPPGAPYGVPAPRGYPQVPPALLRTRRSPLAWVAMAVLGLGALVIAVLLLLAGGPAGALATTLLAALSFPLLIAICFWLDRYEPEPARYRAAALGWGGVVAVGLSLVLEDLLFALPGTGDFVDTAITAPLVEEAGKGLFLVAIVVFRRSQVHGLLDGIVYAALVGIGFAFVEDISYYLSSLQAGELPVVFVLRGVMGPFAHPLFTSATGVGVGLAVTSRRPEVRVAAPILGFAVAVTLHGVWNGSTFWGGEGFFTAYLAVMLPLLVVLLSLAIWARTREGRMLGSALDQVARLGWIRPEEIRWVARLSDRMSARAYAKRLGGPTAARVVRGYQQTLTEIGFLHNRAVTGTAPPDLQQRMGGLLQHAADLRPYVILPPPPVGWPGPPPAAVPPGR